MEVQALTVKIRAEGTASVEKALDSVTKKLGVAGDVAKWTAGVIGGALAGSLALIIRNSAEAETAVAQLTNRVRSTGMAAGFSADELAKMAGDLQSISTYGDEALMDMQSLLLTFTQVRGDEFKDAQLAVMNLATAMGSDLKSAALQVGKALNDPILGVTALARSGIQFSESQKAMITSLTETGRIAEAQRIILKELETQFGGTAEAARGTLAGAMQSLSNAFGDLFEDQRVIDNIRGSVETLVAFVNSDAVKSAFRGMTTAVLTLIENIRTIGRVAVVTATLFATSAIPTMLAALATFGRAVMVATVRVRTLQAALATISWPMLAVQAVVFGLGAAWVKLGADADRARVAMVEASAEAVTAAEHADAAYGAMARLFGVPRARTTTTTEPKKAPEYGGISEQRQFGSIGKALAELDAEARAAAERRAANVLPLQVFPPGTKVDVSGLRKSTDEALARDYDALMAPLRTFGEAVGDTLADSVSAGIERAVASGSISEGFRALGASLLAGLGDAMVNFGKQSAAFAGLMAKIKAAFEKLNPAVALAASFALIGIGSALKGAAAGMFGGGGGRRGGGGGFALAGGGTLGEGSFTQFRVGDTVAGIAAGMDPRNPVNITVIGPDDPTAQRQILALINKGSRR